MSYLDAEDWSDRRDAASELSEKKTIVTNSDNIGKEGNGRVVVVAFLVIGVFFLGLGILQFIGSQGGVVSKTADNEQEKADWAQAERLRQAAETARDARLSLEAGLQAIDDEANRQLEFIDQLEEDNIRRAIRTAR